MNPYLQLRTHAIALAVLVVCCSQAVSQNKPNADQSSAGASAPAKSITYIKAFVVDDRLSTLRRKPDPQSEVIHRLRLGHAVYIVGKGSPRSADRYYRVAVTRRTRGWIVGAALALPGRTGEDQRVMKLTEATKDALDRLSLCRLLIERFGKSPLVPRALLLMGEEADRAAQTLTQRARKRLSDASEENWNATAREYFLNDVGLDRYSKLHIVFDFNEATSEYVYDGQAYRDLVRRFPKHEEARLARERIQMARQRLSRHE